MNNDLISREALKNEVDSWGCNDFDKYDFLEAIDKAPTVELTETEVQEVLNKRCMTAVANDYLIALHGARPRGEMKNETIINVLKAMLSELCEGCGGCNNKCLDYQVLAYLLKEKGGAA